MKITLDFTKEELEIISGSLHQAADEIMEYGDDPERDKEAIAALNKMEIHIDHILNVTRH